jgi:hypothetical protein
MRRLDGERMQKRGAVYCAPGCKRCSRVSKCTGRKGGVGQAVVVVVVREVRGWQLIGEITRDG